MPKGICHKYTPEQLLFLETNKAMPRKELTNEFNALYGTNIDKNAINSLCKRKGWLTGRTGYYVPGSESWNKGTKGLTSRNKTTFKKGNVPANVKPIGHERICSKDGFILIKVAEPNPYTDAKTRYRLKHHVIWEKDNGPIPSGNVVRFKDNNLLNCTIDNLEMVTKAEHLQMNKLGYANLPLEIKPTAKACAQLTAATYAARSKKAQSSCTTN